ncbi:hypothetical protein BDQ12DRAFT_162717 [Crucibulum laeve]|uniref:Armadillo-type protein n=1 Tax=Crucibulum laeve TaxID=68775 RepID=A0A5C3MEI3_9AGAR|nr:hypothetical protein BDQ12DRAFT_162717 [Crucibulum laeve]
MVTSTELSLNTLLKFLQIPAEYARYEQIVETEPLAALDEWKCRTKNALGELAALLKQRQADEEKGLVFSIQEQADLICAVVPFAEGDGEWRSEEMAVVARGILETMLFLPPSVPLLRHILTNNIKPIFRSNPHPSLNLETGRKLARPAGGPMASQDYYDSQTWKQHPGVGVVVQWCANCIEPEVYEELWHLIIPPTMALLDDYEVKYKIQGIQVVSTMLERVPASLLKRTGIDGLIHISLKTCLSHLQNEETPRLLRSAISTSLTLTQRTTDLGTSEHFNQLCALLGEGIISGIWTYADDKPAAVLATYDALPPVLEALGVGCSRYLNVLVPQLVHPLLPKPLVPFGPELQIAALRALNVIIEQCAPRIQGWKTVILDAVGRCWVTMYDSERDKAAKGLENLDRDHGEYSFFYATPMP